MKMGNQRPTTRSKNKRTRPDENVDNTSEIFRKILSNGEVTEDDASEFYMTRKPVCQGCRVNTKDNPNCFCGLIPAPNGSRKSGLWQKNSEIVNSLGYDPSEDLRESSRTPAGLTNLGATCYANSILQCLYMNKSFREGIFSVEPEVLDEEPVLNNLARLFAQLQCSKKAFVDSGPFIKTLELDNAVQQDSHEFLTLLFSLLERCLHKSKVPKVRTLVQDLFRGGVSHVTKCSKCGNASEASSKIEDFYELELNVKGLKSLDRSLNDYLSTEELEGDNQYYCDACATRVDASRSIKLRSLPAVLNFQLKRCVFLPNATTRKKITSAFCFPGELSMKHRLSEYSELDLVYDLSAVLIHKGSSVNSGHYTAHIKDKNTDEWWEFDDESVSNLGGQPFGPTSSRAAKPGKDESLELSSPTKQDNIPIHQHEADDMHVVSSDSNGVHHGRTFTSTDAYMLMYVLRRPEINGVRAAIQSGEHKMEMDGYVDAGETDCQLPAHLLKGVQALNITYLDSCEQYKSKKQLELDHITERRQEVRSIIAEAPVKSPKQPYFWISTDWLRQWADSITATTIDNTSIQCSHGKVSLSRTNQMKCLSQEAWTMLFSKYHGGPIFSNGDYCTTCIIEMARNMVRTNVYMDQRLLMKELAEAALAGESLEGKLYLISKSWYGISRHRELQQWIRRKNVNMPCEADSGPTASIRCHHGELRPELAPGAKRLLVPETLWNFIQDTAMTVKPDDSVGCSTFLPDSETCGVCSVEYMETASSEDNLRDFKLKQRKSHEKLVMNKNIALCPDTKYYLLPSTWISQWRSYINATGKNSSSVDLDTLITVIGVLLCEKHGKLLERPPELHWKRDAIFQKSSTTDGLTIISEDDWRLFCEEWGGRESLCISARIEVDNIVGDEIPEPCKEIACSEGDNIMVEEVNLNPFSRLTVQTSPQVCEECIGERESSELMKKLNFTNEDVCVFLIRGKEPPKSILEASGGAETNRRTSKRSRKSSNGNSVKLNVSASTTIYQLKMMIWQSFGVVKENQVLHKGSRVIEGEISSLADENIFPGDTLWVTDSNIHENRDIADEISDPFSVTQKAEEGFRGTLLTSMMSSQTVSEA